MVNQRNKGFDEIHYFHLEVGRAETFVPWIPYPVMFFVHSPFVPVNSETEINRLEYGCTYEVRISLEEEHLLPEPYHTNCTDYDSLWEKNNRTGPRSQEMCKILCWKSFYEMCRDCSLDPEAFHIPNICKTDDSPCKSLIYEEIDRCELNCKSNCLKLKYHFIIKDTTIPNYSEKRSKSYRDQIKLYVFVGSPDVRVMTHNPLYNTGELFSYIGGLMGCWLGISVWASVGILEKFFVEFNQVKQLFRKKMQHLFLVKE
ncbi:uncharacterized protein NPIL_662431 [Nephila pilipes]|uniref:Uncharacterized protein n=1 Tax=Nephila pilipes TaxID=299642 RepID=A0A8X6UQ09_NEPPI|nr:uncharacterized protein NPIL_662431 [Nephila pilipes]